MKAASEWVPATRRLLRSLRCRRRAHRWANEVVRSDGIAVVIPVCTRCGEIDAANISAQSWNRERRRATARALAKRITR